MKRCTKIILAGMFVFLVSAGKSEAQVGSDGNLAYTFSSCQADNPAANNPETFVIRNRLDSGWIWTASADAMIMSRSGGKTSSLLLNAGTGGELLNEKNINFPWAAGPRVSIVREDILCGCDLEASYFGIDGWSAEKDITVPAAGADFRVYNATAFTLNPGDEVNYYYISRLHSMEINLRHPIWERLDVLMGFRYVELHEVFSSTVNDTVYLEDNVDNHLYGGQIGMNFAFVNTCRCSIEGVIKAGVYGNSSDITMKVRDRTRLGDTINHTAALAEIGLMGIFQVTERLAARLGYQAMWLDGIAIAGDQVENLNTADPKPYMGGTLFYHGATAGFEFTF
ncbi:MAG: BBP7 family outer membrane beta-barrel protein [Thermoguttaceae bacterium]|jgi:hypothetical protein